MKWMPVIGFEKYEANKFGQIRSAIRHGKYRTYGGMMIKQHKNTNTYMYVMFLKDNRRHFKSVARIIASIFCPNPHGFKEVNHKNGDKYNNCSENLEWCTRSQNIKHAYDTGLITPKSGENHCRAKLKNKDVIDIRTSVLSARELSKKYSIAISSIYAIKNKEKWRHV